MNDDDSNTVDHDSEGRFRRSDKGVENTVPEARSMGSFPDVSSDQRQELELQLIKIRNEASAARLEARAAEIELMIRRLGKSDDRIGSSDHADDVPYPSHDNLSGVPIGKLLQAGESSQDRRDDLSSVSIWNEDHGPFSGSTFDSWDDLRRVVFPDRASDAGDPDDRSPRMLSRAPARTRFDAAHALRPHHFSDSQTDPPLADDIDPDQPDRRGLDSRRDSKSDASQPLITPTPFALEEATTEPINVSASELAIESDDEEDASNQRQRNRPGAWLASTMAHIAILMLLAAIGLSTQRPKDQVALTASAASSEEVSMESFTIASSDPQPESTPDETNPAEMDYDLSPVGEISAADIVADSPPASPTDSIASMFNRSTASAAMKALKSDSESKMEFCGVKGGGNHFVYLVDSSGSMGEAFNSARAALLRSIDLLNADQRFYVVFFDAEPDYMRVTDPNADEPRSIKATPGNKAALKRWAMRISMNRGRAPYDPLRFALKLKPDVIFLLSDGEFPQGIEDLLKEENRVVNLFGDDDPISIVHTISYHSQEGESRMRRIAKQNQGQYRHVPKP